MELDKVLLKLTWKSQELVIAITLPKNKRPWMVGSSGLVLPRHIIKIKKLKSARKIRPTLLKYSLHTLKLTYVKCIG